jgi:hypothetical protein
MGIIGITPPVHIVYDEFCRGVRMTMPGKPDAPPGMWLETPRAFRGHWAASVIYPLTIG